MMKHARTQGFSLAEVVIAIGLFVLILFVLFNFFVTYNATYRYERALIQTAGSASAAVRDVEAFTLQAYQVVSGHTFTSGTYTSSSTALVLELPAIDSSANVIVGAYDYVAFYLDGTNLYRILETDPASTRAGGTKLLSTTVTDLLFTYDNTDVTQVTEVTISIDTATMIKGDPVESSLTQQVRLRNFISS
jgi:type II secretory pathway component PulJ